MSTLSLLGAWAEVSPQLRNAPEQLSNGNPSSWGHYWHTGLFLQGPYWSDVETLWDDHLERQNGECNLHILYVTTFAAQEDSHRKRHRPRS